MGTTLGHLRQHFNDPPPLVRSGRIHIVTPFAKSLIARLNRMIAEAHDFAALRPDEIQLDIDQKIRVVASDYAFRTCLNDVARHLQDVSPNVRLEILPLSERSPRLLANGEVEMVLSGQSFDISVSPNTCLL